MTIKLPIATKELQSFLPHRPPMVWVDTVENVDAHGGVCRIEINPAALYFGPNGIRPSVPAEWIAQSYGYIRAVQVLNEIVRINQRPKVAFLAQIRKATNDIGNQVADQYFVKATLKRELGPLALVQGIVEDNEGSIVASAELKVFAE